ncbi:hypothetical protein FAZ97_30320 [Paraburkholderia acidiphila]|uniref:AcrB/AcrD/AcrF family protein n=1 Tax=Paraburkholderia acidiphila TaxID=2571747 RepID=A0A7Z2GCK3_9BURK|nr:hypothetical protein FAZ97_30320 [Paraburkholderia acidiphila]
MIGIVRIALKRPYMFVVLAVFIVIIGVLSSFRTPTDIFPSINLPVISVVWQYTGLSPDQMEGRVMAPYERVLTTTVNGVQHIEGTSLTGYGIVKIFFQPGTNIATANAQVTAISQQILKQLPPSATPPFTRTSRRVRPARRPFGTAPVEWPGCCRRAGSGPGVCRRSGHPQRSLMIVAYRRIGLRDVKSELRPAWLVAASVNPIVIGTVIKTER